MENEYNLTKIKAVIKLYRNTDPTIQLVPDFEERAVDQGHQLLVKEAKKYANEIGITLHLSHPHPTSSNNKGEEVSGEKVKKQLKTSVEDQLRDKIRGKKWHGKFLKSRWNDEKLNQTGCFAWLTEWKHAPTYTIVGMMELYEQLTPTKLYTTHKRLTTRIDVTCRLCGKAPESLARVLAGCSALAQNKYLSRHNAALKKYGSLRWEIKQQFPAGNRVEQYNVIIDVLGGWSRDLDATMRKMLGPRERDVLFRMQRAVISSTLKIARTFKVIT